VQPVQPVRPVPPARRASARRTTVRSLLDLEPGAIVELDRMAGSPVDLLVNGRLIARGEVVVIDEEFALRVTEIVASAVEADR
jgi:flagellar motor switch protein FliN